MNEKKRTKRLKFATKYEHKNSLKRVVWTHDQVSLNCSDRRRSPRCGEQEMLICTRKDLTPTVKHRGRSVCGGGVMSASGVGTFHIINGIMDHTQYISILKRELPANVEKMQLGEDWFFMQDNDPEHFVYNTKMWRLYNKPKQLHTPRQSPNINPIEEMWEILDKKIRERKLKNREALKTALLEEWDTVPACKTENHLNCMQRRLKKIIRAKGYPKKYGNFFYSGLMTMCTKTFCT